MPSMHTDARRVLFLARACTDQPLALQRLDLLAHGAQQEHSCRHHDDRHRGALHGLGGHLPGHVQEGE